jgi:glycosyltransferase involved in cell wall biosynthesis
MKIAFVFPTTYFTNEKLIWIGGTESQIYGISESLANMGHEIYLLSNFKDKINDINTSNSKIHFVHIESYYFRDGFLGEPISAFLFSIKAKKKLKKIKPDLIILNGRDTSYPASKLKIPKFFVTHNPDGMDFFRKFSVENNKINYIYFYYKKLLEEKVIKNCDSIIALNRQIQNYLFERNFKNVVNIPNAINETQYKKNPEKNFILFAGRLERVKGIEYLIEAFNNSKDIHNFDLRIVGSGSYENKLKALTKILKIDNRVIFIPILNKSQLSHCLSNCLFFVIPSMFECMPVTSLEAMASFKPVIGSDIPGINDVITHKHDGLLFEKGNIDELKKCLEMLIESPELREKMGKNARKTIEEKYTFDIIAQKYIELYNKIAL